MQHEITTAGPLLDGSDNLREPGYAKRLLPIYRRADIKAPASRIKEWDYYLIANDHFAVALTIDDNGYMGLDSISFLHFDQRWERTKSPMRAFPMGRTGLPESSSSGGFCSYFVRYSLPDFLWAFGLCCALHAVVLPNGRRSVPVSLFSALVGCAWELLQLAGIVGGTFDPLNCLMYLAAAFAVTMITIINERGRKK